ncbi:MAG: Abi family protein [Magnetococcales bacterium]|nr:Abi family protein [Magnetococcales bacterium]
MAKTYTKLPLSFDEQLNLLAFRGLTIDDRAQAREALATVSYYRLSAYWHPFRVRDASGNATNQFELGSHFSDVITLYEFDRQLRLVVMDAMERVEVAIRTQATYRLAHTYGTFAHTDPGNFQSGFLHANWLAGIENEVQRSKEQFIHHFQQTYLGFPTLPIWMATEVMSMGALSLLYKWMKNPDRKAISEHFNTHHMRFGSNLHTLTYIRNICAHHSRLWNREFAIPPHVSRHPHWQPPVTPRHDRLFYVLLVLRQLLSAMGTGEPWQQLCSDLIAPIAANDRWRKAMGMPEDWEDHMLWKVTP